MVVSLNGQLMPEEEAKVSILDRSFLYGDGLFETIPIYSGKAFRLGQHLERLSGGAKFLGIRVPFSPDQIASQLAALIDRNATPNAVARLTLSRGAGPRGYSTQEADRPVLVITLHPAHVVDTQAPARWRLVTSSLRVIAQDPVALWKTANKLRQVLARAEAEESGADEALLLNTHGEVAETTSANVFWVTHDIVRTPPMSGGALPGVTRAVILDLCARMGLTAREEACLPQDLVGADGVFLTLSSRGVVEVMSLDGQELAQSPTTPRLYRAYFELVASEARW